MKTWLPGLSRVLLLVCGYIGRNQIYIKRHLPEENWPLLDAVLTACQALDTVLQELIPD